MSNGITALTAQNAVYSPGVTVEKNTNPDWDADYTATFVYEDKDARDAERVTVSGNFQFYSLNDPVVKNYEKTADPTGAKVYSAYDYDKDNAMFNVSGGQNNDTPIYELEETGDERFEITLPLPGNQYFYDYTVEYSDGSKVTIQDPVNPSKKNSLTDHDSGHSVFYVGNSENTTAGQEYIYPRADGQTGKYEFIEYKDAHNTDEETQSLGVYLPYNYDPSKTYKTIYVSHGGGGNEAEWMEIGSLPNIMDNILAEKEAAESVVVTMDNSHFGWDYDLIAKNFKENIIPASENFIREYAGTEIGEFFFFHCCGKDVYSKAFVDEVYPTIRPEIREQYEALIRARQEKQDYFVHSQKATNVGMPYREIVARKELSGF